MKKNWVDKKVLLLPTPGFTAWWVSSQRHNQAKEQEKEVFLATKNTKEISQSGVSSNNKTREGAHVFMQGLHDGEFRMALGRKSSQDDRVQVEVTRAVRVNTINFLASVGPVPEY